VKTKSIYEPAGPGDGARLLITRYYPRGVKKDRFDRWVKPLSPSRDLLSSYRSGEKSWGQFRRSFLLEIRSSLESLEALRALDALSKVQDVTLLCYEKAGLPCHRYVVQEILTKPSLRSSYLKAEKPGEKRPKTTPNVPSTLRTRGVAKTPSTRISFYSRRKVGRKAPK
jgi:uncharacterized protein YeaO (DUF488 family)